MQRCEGLVKKLVNNVSTKWTGLKYNYNNPQTYKKREKKQKIPEVI